MAFSWRLLAKGVSRRTMQDRYHRAIEGVLNVMASCSLADHVPAVAEGSLPSWSPILPPCHAAPTQTEAQTSSGSPLIKPFRLLVYGWGTIGLYDPLVVAFSASVGFPVEEHRAWLRTTAHSRRHGV